MEALYEASRLDSGTCDISALASRPRPAAYLVRHECYQRRVTETCHNVLFFVWEVVWR